jgi:hypothetical protein
MPAQDGAYLAHLLANHDRLDDAQVIDELDRLWYRLTPDEQNAVERRLREMEI